VIYRSISGFTKKYAEWIAKECNADIYDAKEFSAQKLSEYSTIIFGGSLHAVGITGIKLVKENLPRLTNKKIVVFAVGASPPKEGIVSEIMGNNFSSDEQSNLKLFYLRGGFDFDKLDFSNKVIMALFKVRLRLKKNKSSDEIGMLAAYSKPMDFTRKENIKQLVDYVHGF
jgi:menaquinone-dependent protoporphyrinogen IX oxidase